MKVMGKVVFLCFLVMLFIGCSINGQLQSSNDTQWSSYYQAMHDQVQSTNPEMDHVLAFCDEMVKAAKQYEQDTMSREQFLAKQQEMRSLLQKEDEYRKLAVWRDEVASSSPMEEYLQTASSGTERTVDVNPEVVQGQDLSSSK